MASGATFAAIALGQMANAFACRSDTVPVWRLAIRDNLFVVVAVAAELLLLAVFLGVTPLARLLGGAPPPTVGWACAFGAASMLIVTDAVHKYLRRRRLPRQDQ
jgi:magnesium-transporting ATPase (P-type)